MQQTETNHPITELADALDNLDWKFDEVCAAEKVLAEAKSKYQQARQRAQAAYMPAFSAAEQMGEKIGSNFQRGTSLITFDEEGVVSVAPFECQYTFQLKKMLEPKTPPAGEQTTA